MEDQSNIPPMFRIEWIKAAMIQAGMAILFKPTPLMWTGRGRPPVVVHLALAGSGKKPVAYIEEVGGRFHYVFKTGDTWHDGSSYATWDDAKERTRNDIAALV